MNLAEVIHNLWPNPNFRDPIEVLVHRGGEVKNLRHKKRVILKLESASL